MDEDGSDRHSAVGQDLQRAIVDHGTRSIGDRLHTAHCCGRAQDKHRMRAQQRALSRFAAHRDNVANAYVNVVSLHRHVSSARVQGELRSVECVVVIEHIVVETNDNSLPNPPQSPSGHSS